MKYVIKHRESGKYFYIKHFGLDLFNLGINPKIYLSEDAAKQEILLFDAIKAKQLQIYYNTTQGLYDHGKPKWYDERHTKKLTEKQKQKLEWYENAHATNEKNRNFINSLTVNDLIIEEYKE